MLFPGKQVVKIGQKLGSVLIKQYLKHTRSDFITVRNGHIHAMFVLEVR